MNIKNDYSMLFNSLNSSNNSSNNSGNIFNAIDLSEYHSIRSGSYRKLLKAYYAKNSDETTTEKTKDTDSKKKTLAQDIAVEKLTEVSASASTLEDSAEKLINRGTDSLFREKELTVKDENGVEQKVMGYDMDAIYDAVADFANKYNSFLKSVNNSDSSKLDNELDNMTSVVSGYKPALEEIGITFDKNNNMVVDKDKLQASDVEDVKKLFNGNASFTYKVASKASMIGVTANSEANSMKNYTNTGDYSTAFSSGNLMDSLI